MTTRWKTGKEPSIDDIMAALSNSVVKFYDLTDLKKMAQAVQRLYRDREIGKR